MGRPEKNRVRTAHRIDKIMRVFVTGACGYVGYSVIQHLLTKQALEELVLYDNLQVRNPNFFLGETMQNTHKVRFVQGDLLDNYTLERALKGIDTVIHLAAKVSTPFADSDTHGFDQVNNWGTACLANAIEQSDSIKTVIYSSSISVYGNSKGEAVNEESLTAPKTAYGASKLKGEKHLSRLSDKVDVYIMRIGNVFGFNPCIRLNAVVNKLMFEAQYKGKVEIHGTGDQRRAFSSVNCVGQYFAKLCFKETDIAPGLYNCVNYNHSINEIVESLRKIYPELEILHLDQHLEMRSIAAESLHDIDFTDCFQAFDFHLMDIKNQFTF